MKCLLFVCITLVLTGCLASKPTKYYLLEVEKPSTKAPFYLRRLELAAYLEQNSLIRRCDGKRIEYLEGHSWATGLRRMFEDSLKDAMDTSAKRSISFKIRRFEAADDNKFHVNVEYIEDKGNGEIAFELPCNASNPESIAATANQALAELLKRLTTL
ncbi:MAG: membrane integrity-associated transporter subunit PqiC [Victivallales bacterium]|nr:membrane integrity-associated transporter subunit PqiC [Victivallales bacterium]